MKIKVTKTPQTNPKAFTRYTITPDKPAYQLALIAITHWSNMRQLVDFALAGHGYGNTNTMSGITYETDLDDYDRTVDKVNIPVGYVQAYLEYHRLKEAILTETDYLAILKAFLESNQEVKLASLVDRKLAQLQQLIKQGERKVAKLDNGLPKTEKALEKWMITNGYNFNSYAINGREIYEGFGIEQTNGRFIWYYIERGSKETLKTFTLEEEAVQYAYHKIKEDDWAKTHCIGLTANEDKAKELAAILNKKHIEFMEDEIPYFGKDKPVYRTFVFGRDKLKTKALKEKYFEQF